MCFYGHCPGMPAGCYRCFVFAREVGRLDLYENMKLEPTGTPHGGLLPGQLGSGRFCQQGAEVAWEFEAHSCLAWVESLSWSLRGRGGAAGGRRPCLPGGICFPAASPHGAGGTWNHLGAPIPTSRRARESERRFDLGCDLGGPGERGQNTGASALPFAPLTTPPRQGLL